MKVETVKLATESGYKIINKRDMAESDKLFDELKPKVKPKSPKEKA